MLSLRKIAALACLAVLAGCSTPNREGVGPVPRVYTTNFPPAQPIEAPRPAVTNTPPAVRPVTGPIDAATAALAATWVPLAKWCATNQYELTQIDSGTPPAYAVRGPAGKVFLKVGSQSMFVDGVDVRLSYAPQLSDGQPMMNALVLQKTVSPLLTGTGALRLSSKPIIIIDPGHGGADSGTQSALGPYYEKAFTLDWALRLRDLLSEAGWQVHLTRTRDQDMSLPDRTIFADSRKGDLFISLHFNASSSNIEGLETYCLTPAGLPSNLTRGFGDDQAQIWPNNAFDLENLHLAVNVHRSMLKATTAPDRGVRRARFLGVLRNQNRPAILVEAAYISNERQAREVATPAHRQKLAQAVADALLEQWKAAGTLSGTGSSTR